LTTLRAWRFRKRSRHEIGEEDVVREHADQRREQPTALIVAQIPEHSLEHDRDPGGSRMGREHRFERPLAEAYGDALGSLGDSAAGSRDSL
jgi:hypothetical protein